MNHTPVRFKIYRAGIVLAALLWLVGAVIVLFDTGAAAQLFNLSLVVSGALLIPALAEVVWRTWRVHRR